MEQFHVAELDMGQAAAVRIGDTEAVLTSNRMPAYDPGFLRLFGIEPKEKRVLALKGVGSPSRWAEVGPRLVQVDTPGCFHSRLILDFIEREDIDLDYNYLTDDC